MKIFLIRHGESTQNTLENYDNFPDFKVELTEQGKQQAKECGEFLKDFCQENNIELKNAKMFISPFERTKQTAKIINKHLKIDDVTEDVLLIERQYGLYDNIAYEDRSQYPVFYKFGKWMDEHDGRFYKKMPLGESPLDVYVRAKLFLQDLKNIWNDKVENVFIISHGMFLKTLQMAFCNYSVDWFNQSGIMTNCSVQLLEILDGKKFDRGYIFKEEKKYN